MSGERLDKHDKIHHELFDEDTAQVGSLGDIVEKHAGDAVFLAPEEHSVGGADGGLSDMEAEMNDTDPASEEAIDSRDLYSADDDEIFAADQTGTVAGIARGFGTHLPQDIGSGGFQVEEIPDAALAPGRPLRDGEELDDYDDEDDSNGQYDATGSLAPQPGTNRVQSAPADPGAGRIAVTPRPPSTADDELDATGNMK